jgi:translation initiation factor 1
MPEMCPRCGLPKEICVCEILDREATKRIKIYKAKAKFRKYLTVIEGLAGEELEKTTKELKSKLACGGTHKNGVIELQGDHLVAAKKELISLGFSESSIDVH